jgi:transglutaminase-like putative cysteine protease
MGSGILLESTMLTFGLPATVLAGILGSRVNIQSRARLPGLHVAIRVAPVALMILLFVCTPYPAKGQGLDLVLAGLLAAESILLLNPARGRAVPGQAALVASGHLLVILVSGTDGRLLVIVLLFVMVSIPFWLRMEADRFVLKPRSNGPGSRPASTGPLSLSIFSVALVFAALLFFLTPRSPLDAGTGVGSGREAVQRAEGQAGGPGLAVDPVSIQTMRSRRTGFSDEVVLGGVTGRELAETRVMTVRFMRENGTMYTSPGLLYMRGLTLDTYENGRWKHGLDYYAVRDIEDADADGWTQTCFPDARGRETIYQDIVLDPVKSAAIFALPEPVDVTAGEILTDFTGTAMFTRRPEKRIRYRVASQWGIPGSEVLNRVGVEMGLQEFTALPHEFQQVKRLALDTTAGERTLLGTCWRIEWFLEENYAYSLEGMPSGPRDPVEIFLFEQQTGCCIDFASAMVVMLRTLKIPSRLACGFTGDEQGDVAGEYVFRGEHAHAWAEVFFGRYGWIRFDPSPLTYAEWRQETHGKVGFLAWFARFTKYGEGDRALFLIALGAVLKNGWWLLPPITLIAAFIVIVRRGKRLEGSRGARTASTVKAADFYRRVLRILAWAGVRPHPASTPREVASAACRVLPRQPVHAFTETYCAVRYGGLVLDPAIKERMKDALAALGKESGRG